MLPDAGKTTKCKTSVIKKELDPTYNEQFSFEGTATSDLQQGALEIWVNDWNLALKNTVIGACRLSSGLAVNKGKERGLTSDDETARKASQSTIFSWMDSTGSEVEHWEMMLERTNEWVYSWHVLRDEMEPGYK